MQTIVASIAISRFTLIFDVRSNCSVELSNCVRAALVPPCAGDVVVAVLTVLVTVVVTVVIIVVEILLVVISITATEL